MATSPSHTPPTLFNADAGAMVTGEAEEAYKRDLREIYRDCYYIALGDWIMEEMEL